MTMSVSAISLPEAYFLALFCEAVLHGVFTVLFCAAMYLILRRRGRRSTVTHRIMTILTVIMYSLSTTHLALSLRQNLIAFFKQDAAAGRLTVLNDPGSPLVYAQIAMETINCLIGDCIVTWRAWVLAGRGCKVLMIPVLCILGGTASSIGLTIAFSNEPNGHEIFSKNIFDWLVPFFAFTIATNLYAVAVISYKTWRHRQSMKALEKNGSRIFESGGFRIAMLLLIESGFLYILVLAVIQVLFLLDSNGVYVVADMLAHLTGIYPVVIIVLVVLQLTQHDIASREATLSTMHFNVVSRIPARNMTHELSTLRIQVNSTNSFDSSRSPMEKGGEPKKCVRLEDFHYASA